jgi:Sulfotransferase family
VAGHATVAAVKIGGAADHVDRATEPVPVVYVLGWYRSGTTLLGNLLGQLPGFISVGELQALWHRLGSLGSLCGCGLTFNDCPFWSQVRHRLFGDTTEGEAVTEKWQKEIFPPKHRWRLLPLLLGAPARATRRWAALPAYAARMADLYAVVSDISGGAVVIDTSKEAADAALIATIPTIRACFVHIVRDPRGAVYSHLRAEPPDGKRIIAVAYLSVSWAVTNVASTLVRLVRGRGGRSVMVRYEDLVLRPDSELTRIVVCTGRPLVAVALRRDGGDVWVERCHTADGNPARMRHGRLTISEDRSWETGLTLAERTVIFAITWPFRMISSKRARR